MKAEIGSKVLMVGDLYFFLPNNFDGTYGDALMLLAKYQIEKESLRESKEGIKGEDAWNFLTNDESSRHVSRFVIAEKTSDGWKKMDVKCGIATDEE